MKMKKLKLNIPTIDTEFVLEKQSEKPQIWECRNSDGEIILKISSTSEKNDFKIITKDNKLSSIEDREIINFFLERYIETERDIKEQEISGIEDTEELPELVAKPDFDPEQITVRPQVFPIFQLVYQLLNEENPRIDLSPDFQRYFVWKEVEKKSRLIESLLLRIPLPVFYLAEDGDGNYQVVDGLQRLTTIQDFVMNKFKLKKLEYLEKECGNKTFEELKTKYQSRLTDTQLTFNIISAGTPVSVKTEIFKRLNLGGKPLNRQEIRNSLSKPKTRNFIKKMAESEEFKTATNNSIKPLRMEDQELVMRYVGFYLAKIDKKITYKGDMDAFLDDVLDLLNKYETTQQFDEIVESFIKSMQNATYLFGEYAFRKILPKHIKNQHKPPINKSLFTAWSVLLSQYSTMDIKEKTIEKAFVTVLVDKIQEDNQYFEALTTGTNQIDKLIIVSKRLRKS